MDELREFYEAPLPPGGPMPERPGSNRERGLPSRLNTLSKQEGAGFRPMDRPTVGVVDAEGEVITMLDPDGKLVSLDEARSVLARRRDGPNDKQREQFRASMKRLAEGVDDKQEIGYTMAKGFDGKSHLRELIVTPIVGKKQGEPVGAVIVAVLTSDLGERQLQTFSRQTDGTGTGKKDLANEGISSGFWLDGKLHTETIPDALHEPIATAVAKHLEAHSLEGGKFIDLTLDLVVHGETVPHKLLYLRAQPWITLPAGLPGRDLLA